MQGVTLSVAVIFSLLALTLRPAYALAAYVTALLWYPSYLAVSVGTIDILVGRFVVAVLLLRCLCDDRIRSKFTWCRLDTWVTLCVFVFVAVRLLHSVSPLADRVENRGGFLMDTWFAYMVARFIMTDRAKLISIIKCISVVLVPLAILGVMESVSSWQPFLPLKRFRAWDPALGDTAEFAMDRRWGFSRAIGPFSHAILFGGGFAMFLPLIYYLRYQKNSWGSYTYLLSGIVLLGALSSMSSGPWVMTIVVVFCLALEKHKTWVKSLFIFAVVSCIFIGIASNRRFYHVIADMANPLGGAGWHRAKIIDLAIERFDEWWLGGYGGEDPGWGPELGMGITDVTNAFVAAGVHYGILGVIVFCAVIAQAFRDIVSTHKKMAQQAMRSLCWAFGSLLFAVVVTMMSVSFFGQLSTLFYCVLGMIGSLCHTSFNWQIPNRVSLAQNRPARAVS